MVDRLLIEKKWEESSKSIFVLPLGTVSDNRRLLLQLHLHIPNKSNEKRLSVTTFGAVAEYGYYSAEFTKQAEKTSLEEAFQKLKKHFFRALLDREYRITEIISCTYYDKDGNEFEPIDRSDSDYWTYVGGEPIYIGPEIIETGKIVIIKKDTVWKIDDTRLDELQPVISFPMMKQRSENSSLRMQLLENYLGELEKHKRQGEVMDHLKLLEEFTLKDETFRPDLKLPFRNGDYVCSTNGHVGVMIPEKFVTQEFDIGKSTANLQEIVDQSLKQATESGFVPFTVDFGKLPEFATEPVYKKETAKCSKCNGEGVIECGECGNETDCKKCGGDGEIEIDGNKEIIGTKISKKQLVCFGIAEDQSKSVNGYYHYAYFNPEYIVSIGKFFTGKLNVLSIAPNKSCLMESEEGIRILLMPMRYTEDPEIKVYELERRKVWLERQL